MSDISNRCPKCGRMHPVFAKGSVARNLSDRLLVYEGWSSRPFTYRPAELCMVDRFGGTRNLLGKQAAVGDQLKAWLVLENERG